MVVKFHVIPGETIARVLQRELHCDVEVTSRYIFVYSPVRSFLVPTPESIRQYVDDIVTESLNFVLDVP
jgi:hypothetical protein